MLYVQFNVHAWYNDHEAIPDVLMWPQKWTCTHRKFHGHIGSNKKPQEINLHLSVM